MFSLIRKGSFYGGVFLPSAKSDTEDAPIAGLATPPAIYVPIRDIDAVVVEPGQRIDANACIATSTCERLNTHSALAGIVKGVKRVDTAHLRGVRAIHIEAAPDQQLHPPAATIGWPEQLPGDISEILSQAGLQGKRQTQDTLACQLLGAREHGVDVLIINGMESEPCITADHRLLSEYHEMIVKTAAFLHDYVGARRTALTLDKESTELVKTLLKDSKRTPVRIVPLPNRYPQSFDPLLIQAVTGREIPNGKSALDIGVVVLKVNAIFHIARALLERAPLTARTVTVTGDAVAHPRNYWIAHGTPVSHILSQVGLNFAPHCIIAGGPLTGTALPHDQVVSTPYVAAILALSSSSVDDAPPTHCVRCGWCLEVCPTRLDPAHLFSALQHDKPARAQKLSLDACVECGLCSYVCPSSLPLASTFRSAKAGGSK